MHEYSKKSLEERLNWLDKAHPSTSSPLWRTLAKNVQSVEKQTTQLKITGQEEKICRRARKEIPKVPNSSGNKKKADKRGKGKEKAPASANVLEIADLNELLITSSKSIKFSGYKTSEKVEWFLDSGCIDHITPRKSDFVQYRELKQAHSAEIADGKYLKIEGFGTIIRHSIMPNGSESLQIWNVLYVPEVNKWLFCW